MWHPTTRELESATPKIYFNRNEIRRNVYQYGGTASAAMFISTVDHLSHPYWAAMTAVTPMALLMTQLNVKHISTSLVLDRGITTGIGVAIGLSILYLTND